MAVLEIKNLTKKFGGLTAVNDVTFNLEENKILGLIGPNGAGKTTIFNLITGVYKVTEGNIIFNGKTIQNMEPDKIANMGITRTFQNIRLFSKLSVYENILTACHANANYNLPEAILFGSLPTALIKNSKYYKEERKLHLETEELMETMNLHDRRNFIANNLPYGIQRRLEIARALALKPKVLLLDEPAAGMNPDETDKLMELIDEIRHKFNLTILLIEHHMDLIMGVSDNIVVLNFGTKLSEGNPTQIQNDPKVKEAYLGEVDE